MHRRLCAVAVAAVLAAGVSAAHIIGGGAPFAEASTGSGGPANTAAAGVVNAAPDGPIAEGGGGAVGQAAAVARAGSGRTRTQSSAATQGTAPRNGQPAAQGPTATGPLRALAARRGLAVGTSVQEASNLTDVQYGSVLGTEYSMLTPENDMKWSSIHPTPTVYNFAQADLEVSFAQQHGMAVRGHNLAWSSANPAWLTSVPYSRDQLISILHDHITTVVGRYRGKVAQWDVVNEPLSGGFWQDHIGPEYIDMAFQWAHEADPSAKLFLNETAAEGLGARSDQFFNLVRGLRQRGVPVNGVGLESHFDLNPPPLSDIAANMRRLNALGVETAVTELDVRLSLPASAQALDRQRVIYNGLLATCLAASNCKTFVSWGFTDKVSWVPGSYPGYGAALPFDETYKPKPAYYGLRAALGG